MKLLRDYLKFHVRMLRERPYATNAISSVVLMLAGDRVAQHLEKRAREDDRKDAAGAPELPLSSSAPLASSTTPTEGHTSVPKPAEAESYFGGSWARTITLSAWSGAGSCFWAWWYGVLHRRIPGQPLVWVAVTAAVPAPILNAGFFSFSTAVEWGLAHGSSEDTHTAGDLTTAIRNKLEHRWLQTVIVSTQVWGGLNYLNFRLTPVYARVFVGSVLALLWNVFLSLQQHRAEGGSSDSGSGKRHNVPFLWQPQVEWTSSGPRIVS